ncbi:U3 small nucleolar RNA-associated protein 6 [Elsinoe australis]|uniref:U3 small nucleolar RNA-associated protein 6 n=1 Tax=Elsinoe australis TaxID=40998 RepID=A0A4U7AWQ4_9PEZI|nr:U3 small nucleolar RNA-associated protein 6 [Elsinoe australis]
MAAAASDKARFYLEQSVPELQEFKEKGIFSPAEITAIASKRSAFEHRINMAGAATPIDFARYASYEMNLDQLRKKRCKRMGVKGTNFAGQRKVFSVLERGVRRFSGDMGLWMQYLEFCRDEGANSKLAKGITKVLRLHPTNWQLWVWASRHYFEAQGDMALARSYMQRGLRFCGREKELWVQFLKLEMVYVAKVNARRKILKLDEEIKDVDEQQDERNFLEADEVALPTVTATDLEPELKDRSLAIDDATIKNLSKSPALSGAIPMAIVEAAATTFNKSPSVLEDLFDCVATFPDVPCTPKILQQILDLMPSDSKQANAGLIRMACDARLGITGANPRSAAFIPAFQQLLSKFKAIPRDTIDGRIIANSRLLMVTIPYLEDQDELVEEVVAVLEAVTHRNVEELESVAAKRSSGGKDPIDGLAKKLSQHGVKTTTLSQYGLGRETGDG